MARPRKPLISRKKTLEAALRLIDEEGLDAVTIRRLGIEMNVRGVSLYHHFKDKEDILAGACQLAFADLSVPKTADLHWRIWFLQSTLNFFDILSQHPNLIPIMMGRSSLRPIGLTVRNATAGLLAVQGVPPHLIMPLIEALEELVLGAASYKPVAEDEKLPDDWRDEFAFLYLFNKQRGLTKRQALELIAKAAIDTLVPPTADEPRS